MQGYVVYLLWRTHIPLLNHLGALSVLKPFTLKQLRCHWQYIMDMASSEENNMLFIACRTWNDRRSVQINWTWRLDVYLSYAEPSLAYVNFLLS